LIVVHEKELSVFACCVGLWLHVVEMCDLTLEGAFLDEARIHGGKIKSADLTAGESDDEI